MRVPEKRVRIYRIDKCPRWWPSDGGPYRVEQWRPGEDWRPLGTFSTLVETEAFYDDLMEASSDGDAQALLHDRYQAERTQWMAPYDVRHGIQ